MADQPQAATLVKFIPSFTTFEGAPFGPIDLKKYIKPTNGTHADLRYSAQLLNGNPFPAGLICTQDGLLSGIAAVGTMAEYEILLSVERPDFDAFTTVFTLSIKAKLSPEDPLFLTTLKSQVWKALSSNLPVPELSDLLNRPVTALEVYYLFQRFGILTIWDVFNLEPAGVKQAIKVEGANSHYHYYDRGSCLVAAPKDLFSHQRTLEDALHASRALAKEVYKRGWTIEFAGFNKMVRAAWVELQHLGDKHGKKLEILHYEPSVDDFRVYVAQTKTSGPSPS
jgi:hypothetical protein